MRLRPFEYIVLLHPEVDKDGKDLGETKVIVDRHFGLAKDDKTIAMKATRSIPQENENQLDRVEIIVRPF